MIVGNVDGYIVREVINCDVVVVAAMVDADVNVGVCVCSSVGAARRGLVVGGGGSWRGRGERVNISGAFDVEPFGILVSTVRESYVSQ